MLELKVGRLLPRPAADTEEDLLGAVSPDLLYARSLELAAFREVADDRGVVAGVRSSDGAAERPARRRSSRTCTRM